MDNLIVTASALIPIANANLTEHLLKKVIHVTITDETLKEIKNHGGEYVKEVKDIESLISKGRIKVIILGAKERMPLRPISNENGLSIGNNSAVVLFQRGGYDSVLVYSQSEEQVYKDNGITTYNILSVGNLSESRCGISSDGWKKQLIKNHRTTPAT